MQWMKPRLVETWWTGGITRAGELVEQYDIVRQNAVRLEIIKYFSKKVNMWQKRCWDILILEIKNTLVNSLVILNGSML